ncbi:MAG TPA: hypothetical protein VK745_22640 [Polyangiaceae bacterium]|nr:hypothetical protein [Polyangiaceae bacterium]
MQSASLPQIGYQPSGGEALQSPVLESHACEQHVPLAVHASPA